MPTYAKSITADISFYNFGAESTVRALAVVAIPTPGQPNFQSSGVAFTMSTSYAFSLTSSYVSGQTVAKNHNYDISITSSAVWTTT